MPVLDSSTSTSRSSSAARRFTNVVLDLRSVPGSRSSARARATFSSPIAPSAVPVFCTRPERSSRRSAIAPIAFEVSVMKRENTSSSATSSRVSRDVEFSAGAKYLRLRAASGARPWYQSALRP